MKRPHNIVLILAAIAMMLGMPLAHGLDISGRWQSTEGTLHLEEIRPGRFRSYYGNDGGVLVGSSYELGGSTRLSGYWWENTSNVRCSAPREGNWYWGYFDFVFLARYNVFGGTWNYCGSVPTQEWSGKR